MTSKISSFRLYKTLVKDSLHRTLWAFVLALIGFLLTISLPIIIVLQNALSQQTLTAQNYASVLSQIQFVLGADNFAVKIVIILLAVVCGIALFRYLHVHQQADFYHSLPVSRQILFAVNFTTGIFAVVPAYLLAVLITGIITLTGGYGIQFFTLGAFCAGIMHLVFFLLIYAFATLCAIVCGNTIVSILLWLWTMFSACIALVMFQALESMFYVTHVSGYSIISALSTRLSPVIQYFCMNSSLANNGYQTIGFSQCSNTNFLTLIGIYCLAAVFIICLSLRLFVRRKSERAGASIAFGGIKAPLKFWCVAIIAIISGFFLQAMANNYLWFALGIVLGGALTHCLMEMIYALDFHAALRNWKSFLVFIALFGIALGGMHADILGYNQYVPKQDAVRAVSVDAWGDITLSSNSVNNQTAINLQTPENIAAAVKLGELGVSTLNSEQMQSNRSITVYYKLHSGRVVARTYAISAIIDGQDISKPYLQQIMFSEEYIRAQNILFHVDPAKDTLSLTLYPAYDDNQFTHIENKAQIQEIVRTLRTELLQLHPEDIAQQVPYMRLHVNILEQSGNTEYFMSDLPIYKNYTQTLALIAQYTDVALPTSAIESIASVIISQQDLTSGDRTFQTVTDTADIAALLQNAMSISTASIHYNGYTKTSIDGMIYTIETVPSNPENSQNEVFYASGNVPLQIFAKYFTT